MAHSTFDERILRVAREAGFGIKAYSYDFVTNRIRKVFPLGTQVGDLRIKAAIAGLRASHRDQFAGEERDYRRESAAALLDRANGTPPKPEKSGVSVAAKPALTPEQRAYLSTLSRPLKWQSSPGTFHGLRVFVARNPSRKK
jgi:hypothetical protein